MRDASEYLPAYVDIVATRYPEIAEVDIPTEVSNTITLSTMHGCPPDEIERIMIYLLEERGLHSSVKCNPTLLGADRVRGIVGDDLGFDDIPIPDEAFGHDLMYVDAGPMFHNLRRVARERNLTFGLKLTNTLEVENWRTEFADDEWMYLSGRALHPVTANLANLLNEEFRGDLLFSFAGGADAFKRFRRPAHRWDEDDHDLLGSAEIRRLPADDPVHGAGPRCRRQGGRQGHHRPDRPFCGDR